MSKPQVIFDADGKQARVKVEKWKKGALIPLGIARQLVDGARQLPSLYLDTRGPDPHIMYHEEEGGPNRAFALWIHSDLSWASHVQYADGDPFNLLDGNVFPGANSVRIEGGTAHISLVFSKKHGYKEATVDVGDLRLLHLDHPDAPRFFPVTDRNTIYAQTNLNARKRVVLDIVDCKTSTIRMHRLLRRQWRITDHIDGNGLNNVSSNLRDGDEIMANGVTAQNANRKLRDDNPLRCRCLHAAPHGIVYYYENKQGPRKTVTKTFMYSAYDFDTKATFIAAQNYRVVDEIRRGVERRDPQEHVKLAKAEDIPEDVQQFLLTVAESQWQREARLEKKQEEEKLRLSALPEEEKVTQRRKRTGAEAERMKKPGVREEHNRRRREKRAMERANRLLETGEAKERAKNNRTGKTGVARVSNVSGREYFAATFRLKDANGKVNKPKKLFSIDKYGESTALQMAINKRLEWEKGNLDDILPTSAPAPAAPRNNSQLGILDVTPSTRNGKVVVVAAQKSGNHTSDGREQKSTVVRTVDPKDILESVREAMRERGRRAEKAEPEVEQELANVDWDQCHDALMKYCLDHGVEFPDTGAEEEPDHAEQETLPIEPVPRRQLLYKNNALGIPGIRLTRKNNGISAMADSPAAESGRHFTSVTGAPESLRDAILTVLRWRNERCREIDEPEFPEDNVHWPTVQAVFERKLTKAAKKAAATAYPPLEITARGVRVDWPAGTEGRQKMFGYAANGPTPLHAWLKAHNSTGRPPLRSIDEIPDDVRRRLPSAEEARATHEALKAQKRAAGSQQLSTETPEQREARLKRRRENRAEREAKKRKLKSSESQ